VLHERTGPVAAQGPPGRHGWARRRRCRRLGHPARCCTRIKDGVSCRGSRDSRDRTRTNSEALLGAMTSAVPEGVDLTNGVAITTSVPRRRDTHVENCRYGKGSNAMGLLATVAVPGGTGRPRWLELARQVGKDPWGFLRLMPMARRWSERMVIGLVMQSRDNSLAVSGKRGLFGRPGLTSRQGHGHPNPTYIPEGHEAMEALARSARGGHGGVHRSRWLVVRGVRRADDGALPRRGDDRVVSGPRGRRRLPPGVGAPRHLGRRRGRRLGQPRGEPVADDHGAGRAGDVAVAQPW
jgi:hypothetical protein